MNQVPESNCDSFSDLVLSSNTHIIQSDNPTENENQGPSPPISSFLQLQNNTFCQVVCSNANKLCVRQSKLNESFSLLPNKGVSIPANREGFCCVEISSNQPTFNLMSISSNSESNTSSILVIGGRNSTKGSNLELFLYSLSNNDWKHIELIDSHIVPRSNHRAVAISKEDQAFIYVFGGMSGLKLDPNILYICLSGECASCSTIECEGSEFPCGRCDHSMILAPDRELSSPSQTRSSNFTSSFNQDSNTNPFELTESTNDDFEQPDFPVRILVFGGIIPDQTAKSGKVLGDLWKLEIRAPYDIPRWTLISQDGPPSRHSHSSFYRNGRFYIAGGYGADNQPYRDVWRYTFGFGWEQIAIFGKTIYYNLLGSTKYGFLAFCHETEKASSSPEPISLEDKTNIPLFVKPIEMAPELALLASDFQKLHQKQKNMYTSISSQKADIEQLEKEIELAQNLLNDPTEVKNNPEMSEYFRNVSNLDKLNDDIAKLRNQVLIESKKLIKLQQESLVDPIHPPLRLNSLMEKLQLQSILKTDKFERRIQELKREQGLYSSQAETRSTKTSQSGKSIQSCQEYLEQLRDLEAVDIKNREAIQRIERMKKKSVQNENLFGDLFQDISNYESLITQTSNSILDWETKVQNSSNKLNKIQAVVNIWTTKPNETTFKKQIELINTERKQFEDLVSNNLRSYMEVTQPIFQNLVSKLNEIYDYLCDESKDKEFDNCKSAIYEKFTKFEFMKLIESLESVDPTHQQ